MGRLGPQEASSIRSTATVRSFSFKIRFQKARNSVPSFSFDLLKLKLETETVLYA